MKLNLKEGSQISYVLSEYSKELTKSSKNFRQILVLVGDTESAETMNRDLGFFCGKSEIAYLPAKEVLPFEPLSPTISNSASRFATLSKILNNRIKIVVTSIEGFLLRYPTKNLFENASKKIEIGSNLSRSDLQSLVEALSYERVSLVDAPGQYALRGSIVDIFPPDLQNPVRFELFGGELTSIRIFNVENQRTLSETDEVLIPPCKESFVFEKDRLHLASLIKKRGQELNYPSNMIRPFEEAIMSKLSGEEGLFSLVCPSANILEYFPIQPEIFVVDESKVKAQLDLFYELLAEREKSALESFEIYPAKEELFSTPNEIDEILKRARLNFEPVFFSDDEEPPLNDFFAQFLSTGTFRDNQLLISELSAQKKSEEALLPLVREIQNRKNEGYAVGISVASTKRAKRLNDLLSAYKIDLGAPKQFKDFLLERTPALLIGELKNGFKSSYKKVFLISEREIFPEAKIIVNQQSSSGLKRFLSNLTQLKEGDYVVHLEHGIGVYLGLKPITIDGKIADFLQLEYSEGSKLMLPVENISKLQKYSGADGINPELSNLGSKKWQLNKEKVKSTVQELAGQLLHIFAEREIVKGIEVLEVNSDDENFADTFPYQTTVDQQKAIDDVLGDLASGKPMDRLVCGDVGYGKTEVAVRAAYKAISSGLQVGILVPTTVLAEQHYETFLSRFSFLPIKVGCVSRFSTKKENLETLEKVRTGEIDLIVGTHRLLQKDVFFKNLGLLIIDEEHRFGVAHKEKLKRYRSAVHILTMTATPIPRTLHLSMVGIRDMSVIETPPVNRQVIRTYSSVFDPKIVREAILRELGRGGQGFYVHNRVENIGAIADELREIVPEARIGIGHGQMKPDEVEEVMRKFVKKEIDILVATTIIESGIDIPNANTIIIRNAERFGLAELYQLRGRVGRSDRRAYAYLMTADPKKLSTEAKRRLEVLKSLDDLGVGFKLALHDMEIRGAGNLLGKDQSGNINSVGFELYTEILRDAVQNIKRQVRGEAPPKYNFETELNIGFPSHIPADYIPDVAERLLIYQRVVEVRNGAEALELNEEIDDRYGKLPDEVRSMLELAELRAKAKEFGLTSVALRADKDKTTRISITFFPDLAPNPKKIVELATAGKLKLTPGGGVSFKVTDTRSPARIRIALEGFMRFLSL